jgi:cytochrome b subunit of formate dehydrogenase
LFYGKAHVRALASGDQLRALLHDISAVIMLGGILIHIYLSTIGEPGTFQAMIRGAVSEAWAWTFHPAWYKQVTGRDPVAACEEARRRGQIVRK